jgi:phosphoribosylformimino-5-aminoimidazole carboxamide ribotide isomerase
MELFPAIDLKDGCCVRLAKGDFDAVTFYERDPMAQARRFAEAGARWLHVVDLDGAKDGASRQIEIVKKLARESGLCVEAGGGIRDVQTIEALFAAGVARVVIGSLAVKKPELVKEWIGIFGSERIALAFDVNCPEKGAPEVLIDGWQAGSGLSLESCLVSYKAANAKWILCTDVTRDGLLGGAHVSLYRELAARWPEMRFLASGGVKDLDDLIALKAVGAAGAVIGKALYEGKIDLKTALALDLDKAA